MAFVLPTFNLTCNIWHSQSSAPNDYALPDLSGVLCNLAMGRRVVLQNGTNSSGFLHMQLLLPKLTDVRPGYNGALGGDLVEVPAGSERFYEVLDVDDVGKGFSNEHRMAFVLYSPDGWTFVASGHIPAPVPLP
jgi:hypothetical protein